jgi:hypothetical protein
MAVNKAGKIWHLPAYEYGRPDLKFPETDDLPCAGDGFRSAFTGFVPSQLRHFMQVVLIG